MWASLRRWWSGGRRLPQWRATSRLGWPTAVLSVTIVQHIHRLRTAIMLLSAVLLLALRCAVAEIRKCTFENIGWSWFLYSAGLRFYVIEKLGDAVV